MRARVPLPFVAVFVLACVLLGPSAAHAQRGVRIAGAPMAPSRTSSARVAIVRSGTNRARSSDSFSNMSPFSGSQTLFPGFGSSFDFFGGNQDLGIKAAIDPATQWRLAVAERLLRDERHFRSGGFYLLDGGGAYVVPTESVEGSQPSQPQQPQVIVLQQAPAQPQPAALPAPESAGALAPLPDEGEFTLVLHDGKQIQAVAFTRMKDRIVYISPDGGRRSIAPGELDPDATVRVNQERGTPLQLPL
jgi:hypothetical protein